MDSPARNGTAEGSKKAAPEPLVEKVLAPTRPPSGEQDDEPRPVVTAPPREREDLPFLYQG